MLMLPRAAVSVMARSLPVAVMLPSLDDENNLTPQNTTSRLIVTHLNLLARLGYDIIYQQQLQV